MEKNKDDIVIYLSISKAANIDLVREVKSELSSLELNYNVVAKSFVGGIYTDKDLLQSDGVIVIPPHNRYRSLSRGNFEEIEKSLNRVIPVYYIVKSSSEESISLSEITNVKLYHGPDNNWQDRYGYPVLSDNFIEKDVFNNAVKEISKNSGKPLKLKKASITIDFPKDIGLLLLLRR